MSNSRTGGLMQRLFPIAAVLCPTALMCAVGATPAASLASLTAATTWRAASTPDTALVAVVSVLAWTVLAWLALATSLALASHLSGLPGRVAGSLADRFVPFAIRRIVHGALGLTLASGAVAGMGSGLASPAMAASTTQSAPAAAAWPAGARGTTGLDWPVDQPASPAVGAEIRTAVVVLRGDTLWDIAARHLGPGADDATIAAEWPRWYAVNRPVIGPNPDLILPGQRLAAPTT